MSASLNERASGISILSALIDFEFLAASTKLPPAPAKNDGRREVANAVIASVIAVVNSSFAFALNAVVPCKSESCFAAYSKIELTSD